MAKIVELRRHTDNDGDSLSDAGIEAAVDLGRGLDATYDIAYSSGAQRATQTLACMIAGLGGPVPGGVRVDARFRSEVEDRWRNAYERAGAGDMASFREADPKLVEEESKLLGSALREVFEALGDGGRALVVGHSPMQEAAVLGLTGDEIEPLGKGEGVLVIEDPEGTYQIQPAT